MVGNEPSGRDTFASWRDDVVKLDCEWRTAESGWSVLYTLATQIFMAFPELEAKRPVPLFVTAHAPSMFPGHKDLLVGMIRRLGRLSDIDRALNGVQIVEDAAELVAYSLEKARLYCSAPSDRAYVGLQILYQRHLGAPEFAAFYGDCLRRVVDGRTTRLCRYREHRDFSNMRCWWVFADEPEGSKRWRVPRWAQQ